MNKDSTGWFSATMIMFGLIALNSLLFRFVGGVNYFLWYLKSGALISIAASFAAVISDDSTWRRDLLSSHPRVYLRGCAVLGAVFFNSLAAHLSPGTTTGESRTYPMVAILWDRLIGTIMIALMGILAFGWILFVAPLNYFVTLITGSVERQHGSVARALLVAEGKNFILTSQSPANEVPTNAVDVSITRKPFALTQALTALVLWSSNLIYESVK